MVVHAIWIIDTSGIPLFHKAYSPLEFDPTLFSSFFSSLVHFQTELMGRQLQDIRFEDLSFSYIVESGLVFLACVKKDSSTGRLLQGLRDIFFKHFTDNMILLSSPLRSSPEAQSLILQFQREIDELVGYAPEKEPLPVRVTAIPRLLHKDSPIRKDLERRFGLNGLIVVLLSDSKHTVNDITEAVGLSLTEVQEIIRHCERRGYVKVVSAYQIGTSPSEIVFPES